MRLFEKIDIAIEELRAYTLASIVEMNYGMGFSEDTLHKAANNGEGVEGLEAIELLETTAMKLLEVLEYDSREINGCYTVKISIEIYKGVWEKIVFTH